MKTKKIVVGLWWLSIFLTACGEPTAIPLPIAPPVATAAPAAKTTAAPTLAATIAPKATAAAILDEPALTEKLSERTVVRSFTDAQGRSVKLLYGRGNGRGGDYGWAHIYGKHVQGIWYDGGTITTFPKALGTKTPDDVVGLLGKSLQDKKPDDAGNGRRSYVYFVPNTNRDVFTVVGNDGTIITSYPVAHGSKDEDS